METVSGNNSNGRRERDAPAYRKARGFLGNVEMVFLTVAAMIILFMTLYVTAGIVLRTFFGGGLYDEIAIIGEMMVASISLPLAFVAANRGFVAVEIFVARAGRKARIWLDIIASTVGLIALVPITISAFNSGIRVWNQGSYYFGVLNLPEWPGYFIYLIGIAAFLLRLTDLILHDLLSVLGVIEDDDPARQGT